MLTRVNLFRKLRGRPLPETHKVSRLYDNAADKQGMSA